MHHANQKSQRKEKFGSIKKKLSRQKAELMRAEHLILAVKRYWGEANVRRKRSGDEDV